jgi:glycosyltransferase involved in cell wall biosynthesis
MRTLVTIGVPTYDRLPYLKEAIAAALGQSHSEIEILISQNPHNDPRIREPIAAYCANLAGSDSRIRYKIHPRNIGAPANYNSIVDAARGDYLALIGDDDRLLPDAIERLLNAMEPDTAVAFGKVHVIDADGNRLPRVTRTYNRAYGRERIPAGRVTNPEVWAWQQTPAIECSLIRTADFARVRFREDVDMPDIGLFIHLARSSAKFVFFPEYVCEYRFHAHSLKGMRFHSMRELVDEFSALAVGPEVEPYKRRVLQSLTFSAASRCLLVGEIDHARRLINSEYYPGFFRSGPKALVMSLCAGLPDRAATETYNFLHALKNWRLRESIQALRQAAS